MLRSHRPWTREDEPPWNDPYLLDPGNDSDTDYSDEDYSDEDYFDEPKEELDETGPGPTPLVTDTEDTVLVPTTEEAREAEGERTNQQMTTGFGSEVPWINEDPFYGTLDNMFDVYQNFGWEDSEFNIYVALL
ncbi:hypothetical protein PG988_002029 [Apiospora saccharicola]